MKIHLNRSLALRVNVNVTHIPGLDDPITEQDVRQAVRNLKQGKTSGLDRICGEFLKYSENIVAPFLTKLFNKLYDMNVFPSDWCKSVIIPLFKKGDDKIPDNYRGISLLSCLKLNKRLYTWAEREDFFFAKNRQDSVRDTLQLTIYLHLLQW